MLLINRDNRTCFAATLLAASLSLTAFACEGGNSNVDNDNGNDGGNGAADSGNGNGGFLSTSGDISGANLPAQTEVMGAWVVSSGSPDYVYMFGKGSATGDTFELSFAQNPPAAALNGYGVGIAYVALIEENTSLAEGELTAEGEPSVIGLTGQHAIIFVEEGILDLGVWVDDFPTGYSCGVCVPAAEGETFDSYAPVDCDSLVIETPIGEVCNWT